MTSAMRFSACAGAANASNDAARLHANAALNDGAFFILFPHIARLDLRCARTIGLVGKAAPPVQSVSAPSASNIAVAEATNDARPAAGGRPAISICSELASAPPNPLRCWPPAV